MGIGYVSWWVTLLLSHQQIAQLRRMESSLFVHKLRACDEIGFIDHRIFQFQYICLSFLCSISSEWIDFIAFALYGDWWCVYMSTWSGRACVRDKFINSRHGKNPLDICEFYCPNETNNCLVPVQDFHWLREAATQAGAIYSSVQCSHARTKNLSTLQSIKVTDWFSNGLFACSSRPGHPTTLCNAIVSAPQCHSKWRHAARHLKTTK